MLGGAEGAISIHAPRTGSDIPYCAAVLILFVFQSTLPARGATHSSSFAFSISANFNPRSPHGERLDNGLFGENDIAISIHAPRTGSDAGRS